MKKQLIQLQKCKSNYFTNDFRCIEAGILNRSIGDTQVHSRSSRSHAIFTITLEERAFRKTDSMYQENEEVILKRSKFHLVDLAGMNCLYLNLGSERVKFKYSLSSLKRLVLKV